MSRICGMLLMIAVGAAAFPPCLHAHDMDDPAKPGKAAISTEEYPSGMEGDPNKARRKIAIKMDDNMRFSQSEIRVKRGDTVMFMITNQGKLMHELVLGTEDNLKVHAEMMRSHPGMEHDEPYMAHVKPGATERLTWTFTKAGTFMYGCLVPGHFEAGMRGTIIVTAN